MINFQYIKASSPASVASISNFFMTSMEFSPRRELSRRRFLREDCSFSMGTVMGPRSSNAERPRASLAWAPELGMTGAFA